LPKLTEKELIEETEAYQKAVEEFLFKYEDSEFKWVEELENSKRKNEAEPVKKYLTRLPNNVISEASKEIILQTEKKILLNKLEKKKSKKGIFSFFSKSDTSSTTEELQKMEAFFDAFISENSENIGKNL